MPLFKKNDPKQKAKLEHKMCIIPPGVFSMCKVFRKDELYLQKNNLTSLKGGGSLEDLLHIKVLDLSWNKISSLPEEIGHLQCLEVLNLANNRLKKLPESTSLLSKLINLDLSNVCKDGTESIMKFLCNECEVEYLPSSSETLSSSSIGTSVCSSPSTPAPPDKFQQYQLIKDRRRKELIELEESMRRNELLQLELGLESSNRRQKLLNEYKQDQERLNSEIIQLQDKKEKEKKQLLNTLNNIEEHSSLLVSQLLDLNEKSKSSEMILKAMEHDRLETEEFFAISQTELEEARKRDILNSMKEMLAAEEKQRYIEAKRLAQSHKNNESPLYKDEKIREWLKERENDQQTLFSQLQDEENLQREAFFALQILKDSQHYNLTQQIKLIEWELTKITDAEIRRKDLKTNCNLVMVAEQRTALAVLLTSLLSQREAREENLKIRLKEMEEQRSEEIKDYWLIQYQKLMERKPQEIIDLELSMDPALRQILLDVGADNYVTQFAMAQIDLKQVATMTSEDMYNLGVANRTLQNSILNATKAAIRTNSHFDAESCCFQSTLSPESPRDPTAPSPEVSPTAPMYSPTEEQQNALLSNIKIWHQTECVVCLDKESAIVFLPCGHVCSCWQCAGGLELCPLCRLAINTKLTLGSY